MGLAPSPTPASSATDAVLLVVSDFDCSGEDMSGTGWSAPAAGAR
ncbi:hypothetical protein T261_00073 [Streptomyces lydicus]|nr:hypothetical protein T261_00073 [Streptomyces lydicus]